ncbi:MAG: dipeptidase [Phycisphaerales bacterium]
MSGNTQSGTNWFDAHLDLAYLAENGRDLHADLKSCRGRYQPASVTLPTMIEGGVKHCLGTIFTEGVDPSKDDQETGEYTYPFGDANAAYRAGMRQLLLYNAWRDAGVVRQMPRRGHEPVSPSNTGGNTESPLDGGPINLGVLVECADPITDPDELELWVDKGVVAIGMAWWHQSRYAGGNGTDHSKPGNGITDLGKELVARMDELDVVHDLSHLSQRSVDELLSMTDRAVIASHSNCRALMGDQDSLANQRHQSDETIKEIASRGGVIGVNLLSVFLEPGLKDGGRASMEWLVRHIEHICEVTGNKTSVGLGSDMDGGFGADELPVGINTPSNLELIAEQLRNKGWSDQEIAGFTHQNWLRFWGW